MSRRLALVLATLAVALALPARAPAAVNVLLGSPDLSAAAPFASCDALSPSYCTVKTFIPTSLSEPGATLVVPADGTIVSWRVKGTPPAKLRLHIVRAAANGQFKGVTTSGVAKVADGTSDNPAAIGISAGEQLGVELTNEPLYSVASTLLGRADAPGAAWSSYSAGLVDGTIAAPTATGAGAEPLFNATVVLAKPLLFSLSSSSGPQTGGDTVVLTGAHLAVVRGVSFGGVPAQILSAGPNQVMVGAPAHDPGPVDVALTTAGGTSDATAAAAYTYTPVSPPPPDTAGPRLTRFAVVPANFRRGVRAQVRYRSDEPGTILFTLQRKPRRGPFAKIEGSFHQAARMGLNTLSMPVRIARSLKPGRYLLLATATDRLGNRSKPLRMSFWVLAERAGKGTRR